jgi:hypothetical protein
LAADDRGQLSQFLQHHLGRSLFGSLEKNKVTIPCILGKQMVLLSFSNIISTVRFLEVWKQQQQQQQQKQ